MRGLIEEKSEVTYKTRNSGNNYNLSVERYKNPLHLVYICV